MFGRRQRVMRILVGTSHPAVHAILETLSPEGVTVETVEAVSTAGAYEALPGCSLAVVDFDALAESPSISREGLKKVLREAGIPYCAPEEFSLRPQRFLEEALAAAGIVEALPPRAVAVASFSGGVGKTTLTLHTVRYVAQRLRLPAAAVEASFGSSAFRALTDPSLPDLYQVVTQGAEPGKWEGATLLPMEYDTARLLLGREDEVKAALEQVVKGHVLTLFDAHAAHPLFPLVQELSHIVVALADARLDAVANALKLNERLDGRGVVVLNRVRIRDRLALTGVERAGDIPPGSGAEGLDGSLGPSLLRVIYPGWRER